MYLIFLIKVEVTQKLKVYIAFAKELSLNSSIAHNCP